MCEMEVLVPNVIENPYEVINASVQWSTHTVNGCVHALKEKLVKLEELSSSLRVRF